MDKRLVEKTLKEIVDPELGVNIVDLGFIYGVELKDGAVAVKMTLTSPHCPMGAVLVEEVKRRVGELEGVEAVTVDLVFSPPWNPEKMSPAAREKLGF